VCATAFKLPPCPDLSGQTAAHIAGSRLSAGFSQSLSAYLKYHLATRALRAFAVRDVNEIPQPVTDVRTQNGFYRTLLIKNIGYQLSQHLKLLNVRHFTLVAVFVAMTKHK
jgi:hypothetical protein